MKLRRLIWIASYLIKYRRLTYPVARRELGISKTTYNRYIRNLRESGMILSGVHACGKTGGGGVDYIAFDPAMPL